MATNKKIRIPLIFGIIVLLVWLAAACAAPQNSQPEKETFQVSYTAGLGGRIEGETEQEVALGKNAMQVIAIPDEGYEFEKWLDTDDKNPARTDLYVTQNIQAIAKFRKITYTVTYKTDRHGRIEGESDQTVDKGTDSAQVTAIPNEGYVFEKWADNGSTDPVRSDMNVTENVIAVAEFKQVRYTVTYRTDGQGIIQGLRQQTVTPGSDAMKVEAVPNEGYVFVKWSDNGSTDPVRRDSEVMADIDAVAEFKRAEYNVSYKADEYGSIVGETRQTVLHGENGTEVIAVPNEGYEFVRWLDNGSTNPIRLDSNVTIVINATARFKRITYTVTYRTDGNGKIEGSINQVVGPGEDAAKVTAIPNVGYEFVRWSDNDKNPERTEFNVSEDRTLIAYFAKRKYTAEYHDNGGGVIWYVKNRTSGVYYGETGSTVRAIPHDGYVFIGWSDGVTESERTEYNVTSDLDITAYFGFSATYLVNENKGGTIQGEAYQTTCKGEDFAAVTAVPDAGYAFCGWSDLQVESARQDTKAKRAIERIAYFAPISKTFRYDFGLASGTPLESSVTFNRYDIEETGYIVPELNGYTFCGWYADAEYQLKVINEKGKYMLGYRSFELETDTLYARWEKQNEETVPVYKILLLFVNEVKATLYPAKKSGDDVARDVHHTMTAMDRAYGSLARDLMSKHLNEWFAGKVKFEVDSYYTLGTASEQNFIYRPKDTEQYWFRAGTFPETQPLNYDYHSIISVFGLNDYDGQLANRGIVGMASRKYGDVYWEGHYDIYMENPNRIQDNLDKIKTDEIAANMFIETFLHEFVHTVEHVYWASDGLASFHDVDWAYAKGHPEVLDGIKAYLLGEAEYNGEIVGIPKEFWTEKLEEVRNWGDR